MATLQDRAHRPLLSTVAVMMALGCSCTRAPIAFDDMEPTSVAGHGGFYPFGEQGQRWCERGWECRESYPEDDGPIVGFETNYGASPAACDFWKTMELFTREQLIEAEAAGGVRYDEAALARCQQSIDALSTMSCEEYWGYAPLADVRCMGVIQGTVPVGGACPMVLDCAGDAYCEDDGYCVAPD